MNTRKIPITVAARLLYHLGEQLISDELVALLELVKNSYDADATKCVVKVDSYAVTPYGTGSIFINDNGNGMLLSTVEKDFLRLATDYKKANKISPYYKRRTLGEKGLGRLSYQRLGRFVQVRTVPRVERLCGDTRMYNSEGEAVNCIDVTMDWDGFSDSDDISSVYATVAERYEKDARSGTSITISGIRNLNFWELNTEKRKRLQDEILALINPFAESKNTAAFNLELDVNGEKFYIDSIDEDVVDKLSDVSSTFSFDGHVLTLEATYKKKYIARQKEQYIKKWADQGFTLVGDELDYSQYEKRSFSVALDDVSGWEKDCQIDGGVNLINGSPAVDFAFQGSIYAVDKLVANRTHIDENILKESVFVQKSFQKIGQLWDRISGVYLYRDQFRILPYGKGDWLGLTERSQKSKATILKQGNVTGYIQLNGEKSERIREQTNRQGVLEDEYGSNLLMILKEIIIGKLFEWDISIRSLFSKPKLDSDTHLYWNSKRYISFLHHNAASEVYEQEDKKLQESIEKATKAPQQSSLFDVESLRQDVSHLTDSVAAFKKASADLQEDYLQRLALANEKLDEYEEILPLLGQTMIVEEATHELSRIYSKLLGVSKELINLSKSLQPPVPRLSRLGLSLNKEISALDMQLNHLLPTQRYKLKDVQNIDIFNFVRQQYIEENAVANRLSRSGIKCCTLGRSFSVNMSVGNMIVILDNIVMNAEYWLRLVNNGEKVIYFECLADSVLRIWDSGTGVSKEIEDSLFEPFRSMKRDGRGLGLYIVQELLALEAATIELMQERNEYGNRYKFEIVFQEK